MSNENTESVAIPASQPSAQPSDSAITNQPAKPFVEKDASARFRGDGSSFRAKLIGVEDVAESRGDKMCQDSILKLKAIVKASGEHKQKIIINVSLNGIKIINLMTAQLLYEHRVDRISFIARDLTDRRAFGYIFGVGEGKHQFFALKTAKVAENVVLALRDLFQVVYDMKKVQVEDAKKQTEVDPSTDAVYAVPNNRPVKQPQANLVQQEGNLFELEQQLENMHQMSDLDAFKNPWPENGPTSPDTPQSPNDSVMFGMANEAKSQGNHQDSSYSDDLAGFNMEALEPAPGGGAKLTKDQILSGFGQGAPGNGMYQQQAPYLQQQQQQQQMQFGQQPSMFGAPQQPAYRPAANPFGGGFGAAPQAPGSMGMGMVPPGPSPAVPARPGAMRPPTNIAAQSGATQNPFGDAFNGGGAGSEGLLAPVNYNPNLTNGSSAKEEIKSDPFANLIPGMGSSTSGPANKKDMFKNFQIAKPPQPPPRSNDSVSPNFDDYFRNSVGGVPLDVSSQGPTPAPRNSTQNVLSLNQPASTAPNNVSSDPFGMFGSSNSDFGAQQQNNNSLFG